MNFKEWIIAEEDVRAIDTSSVSLEAEPSQDDPERKNYVRKFTHKGQNFKVKMYYRTYIYYGEYIPNVYSISFEGPNEYDLTHSAGTDASAIYTQVLLSIKKLMETEDVGGIIFAAQDPKMELVYNRFYQMYLKKNFLRVSGTAYLRKDHAKEALKNGTPDDRSMAYKNLLDVARRKRDTLSHIKQQKSILRDYRLILPKMVKHFAYVQHMGRTRLAFLHHYSLKNPDAVEIVVRNYRDYELIDIGVRYVELKKPVNPADVKHFLSEIGNSEIMKHPEGQQFLPMMKQYGITPQSGPIEPLKDDPGFGWGSL